MFQINKSGLVVLCYLLMTTSNTHGQHDKWIPGASQEYRYSDERIFISLKTNAYEICETDSMELIITIRNKLNTSIFVLKNPRTWYILKSREVVMEYGGMFTSNLELEVFMREVKPKSDYVIKSKLYGKELLSNGFKDYFRITVSFGYIPGVDSVKKYQHLGSIETKKIGSELLRISSIVVEAALVRKDVGSIGIIFKKCDQ